MSNIDISAVLLELWGAIWVLQLHWRSLCVISSGLSAVFLEVWDAIYPLQMQMHWRNCAELRSFRRGWMALRFREDNV